MSEKSIPEKVANRAAPQQDGEASRARIDEIWKLANEANAAYDDPLRSRNTKLHEMKYAMARILEICNEIRLQE